MDSINNLQPEQNRENLTGADAVAKIKDLVDEAKSCFFCTSGAGQETHARPMSVQEVDDEGNLWFLSAIDSFKNQELQSDASVKLYFQGSAHSDFMELNGIANISRDRETIEKLWKPVVKAWFTEGKDDPRVTVIKVTPIEGYYWDTKHGRAIAGIKMMIGAAVGKTLDDSVEGTLDV